MADMNNCHDAVSLLVPQPSHTIDAESGVMGMLCYVIENGFSGCLTDKEKARAASWLAAKYSATEGETHE